MASRYRNFKSEGQDDKNACWAACLVWWLRATNKRKIEQWEIMSDDQYSDLWNPQQGGDGTIQEAGMSKVVKDGRWQMDYEKVENAKNFSYATLSSHLAYGPVYIGYKDLVSNGNHVNVIYNLFGPEQYAQVSVMEPGHKKKSNGKFEGKHLTRSLNYYRNSGIIILGSPNTMISLDR